MGISRQSKAPRNKRGAKYKAEIHAIMLHLFGIDKVVTEHRFHPERQWRFDWAVPHLKLAVEYQGHGQMGPAVKDAHVGGHASVKGLSNDCEKFNQAQLLGWTVIKLTAVHCTEKGRKEFNLTSPLEIIGQIARDSLDRNAV